MAQQLFTGPGIPAILPALQMLNQSPSFNSMLIDATGEKAAFVGPVWFADRTSTKAIRKVGFSFGTVTKAGGSGLTVSLQNASASSGPPFQPDETQDQTVAIANGDAGFTSNAWYQTGNLSADRTVNFGEFVAVVIEYDGSGRLSSDAVNIRGIGSSASGPFHFANTVLKTGGSWAAQIIIPNVILEFSDGSFGTLGGAFPLSACTFQSYAANTAGTDEYALAFRFPGPVTLEGCGGIWFHDSGSDAEVILYSGTTAERTVVVDSTQGTAAAGSGRAAQILFSSSYALSANTTYYLALRPTTNNNVNLFYHDVSAAGHFASHIGGTDWTIIGRLNQGSWGAATTTRRPFMWPILAGIADDAGGAAGGLILPRHLGGGLV